MNLKDSIIKTIKYFDLFDFPLTAEEILEYLYEYDKPVHIKEIKGTLKEMVEAETIEEIKEHYILKGRRNILETRKTRKFIAEKYWNRVKLYGIYMRDVPFVKMVGICNNLAYDNSSEQSDIDLFIVIKPGRMWIARFILTLVLHFYGVRRYKDKIAGRFCLSFFVTTNELNMGKLQIKPEDPYLAYWTKLLCPIYGEETYEEFKTENEVWLKEQYGLNFSERTKKHMYVNNKSKGKKFFEFLLKGKMGDYFEKLLKNTFKKRTLRKMKHLGPEASVIVSDDMLKFHNNDRRKEYLERWMK
ncbi:hypothetical protein JW758_05295 [Candidatus Peregrinibacteria bacterium]|nr:hypothetical protein [Candidatus Peregrinibacteria bacterium]